MFHNTTSERGEQLKLYRERAATQEDEVLRVYRTYRHALAPSQVQQMSPRLRVCPLTSIRRAIHELTDAGRLVKLERKACGPFGRPEYLWELAP